MPDQSEPQTAASIRALVDNGEPKAPGSAITSFERYICTHWVDRSWVEETAGDPPPAQENAVRALEEANG